ncbi:unnamed protein product, partial [marine sediment metagenome]
RPYDGDKFIFDDTLDVDGNLDVDDTIRATDIYATNDITVNELLADTVDAGFGLYDSIRTTQIVIGLDTITDIDGTNLSITGGTLNGSGGGSGTWVEANDSNTAYVLPDGGDGDTVVNFFLADQSAGDTTVLTPGEQTNLVLRATGLILDGGADSTFIEGDIRIDNLNIPSDSDLIIGAYRMATDGGGAGHAMRYDNVEDSTYWADVMNINGDTVSGTYRVAGAGGYSDLATGWLKLFDTGHVTGTGPNLWLVSNRADA